MRRIKSLWKASPRKVLFAFAGLLVAAAVAVGSGANFNSTSANPSNVFTAGTISHSNSKANAAILTATNMVPGDTSTGTVDIKNTGSASGTFSLLNSRRGHPGLARALQKAHDRRSGSWRTDLRHRVPGRRDPLHGDHERDAHHHRAGRIPRRIHAPLPVHGDLPGFGLNGADNAYQGASTSVEYDWSSTN